LPSEGWRLCEPCCPSKEGRLMVVAIDIGAIIGTGRLGPVSITMAGRSGFWNSSLPGPGPAASSAGWSRLTGSLSAPA
jgi:hypothetical protein